ncbi:MAG: polysaccharide pyruvyl transferase CsaB [Porticoccaceae bacterium]|nr:MAG: polysaccharide pyruvyl transferase CsaB [Porticoccaceae bacterium]
MKGHWIWPQGSRVGRARGGRAEMAAPADIVFLGYYGFGNFGDDLLLSIAHRLLRRRFPRASLAVRTDRSGDYFARLLGEPVEIVRFGARSRHRLLVHGGGGTFFDYGRHGPWARLRGVLGRPRLSGERRVGLGIGVGRYDPGSRRLLEDLPVLADFTALWLRDPQSADNLRALGVAPPVRLGSDLAFLSEEWWQGGEAAPPVSRSKRLRVALCLRDWLLPDGRDLAAAIAPAVARLAERCDLTLVSLEPERDQKVLAAFSSLPQWHWRPERMGLWEFAEGIAAHHVIVSARAHGAICAAVLGRPAAILEIEPKLATVHRMLPNSSRLLPPQAAPEILAAAVEELAVVDPVRIAEDVAANRAASRAAWRWVEERL